MSGTKSFSADQVQVFAGTPPDDLSGTMTVLMKTNKYYTDGTLKQAKVSYTVTREWGKSAIEAGWASDVNNVLPLQDTPAFKNGSVEVLEGVASGMGNTYIRWCIPGRDTSGTLFKDVSGRGNDATIDAGNSAPFGVDMRMSTTAGTGGISQSLAATLCDFNTDSFIMAVSFMKADPGASEAIMAFGEGAGAGFPGFYFSHRSAAAGVGRLIANKGDGTLVSGSDTTVKFSNAGGTRETHAIMAYDGVTKSGYLYRDGVLAAANVGLMTAGNAFTATVPTLGSRIGGINGGTVYALPWRGWQAYVFSGSGLPLNINRIAALLAESPSTPLRDHEFQFVAA